MRLAESGEMYLEAIHVLSNDGGKVRSIDVCEYVEYDDEKHLILTESGKETAEKIYERHQVLTRLLVKLGVDEETASEDACKLEHAISDISHEAIKKFLS